MNIYDIRAYGSYCEGIAIIAAETTEQAIQLASEIDSSFDIDYSEPYQINYIGSTDGEARVMAHFDFGE